MFAEPFIYTKNLIRDFNEEYQFIFKKIKES